MLSKYVLAISFAFHYSRIGFQQTRSNYDDMRQIAATAGEFAISCAVICSDRTTEASNELKRALNKFTK
jgi:predicted GNAT superfamily acetyltransferase